VSALGFGLVIGGALLIYAGMTGGSLVKAVQQVIDGKAGDKAGVDPASEAKRDAAQTRRPAQS
jgi:hypothetical protein